MTITIRERDLSLGPQLRLNVPLADTEQRLNQLSTTPYKGRMEIVCTDDCANCILFNLGCASRCTRYPDIVCQSCPCRASKFVGQINEEESNAV